MIPTVEPICVFAGDLVRKNQFLTRVGTGIQNLSAHFLVQSDFQTFGVYLNGLYCFPVTVKYVGRKL